MPKEFLEKMSEDVAHAIANFYDFQLSYESIEGTFHVYRIDGLDSIIEEYIEKDLTTAVEIGVRMMDRIKYEKLLTITRVK